MLSKFLLSIAFFLIPFFQGYAHGTTSVKHPPSEMAILKLPNNDYENWKEISRGVIEKEGLVELIPLTQTIESWSELIRIQYFDRSVWMLSKVKSIESILDKLRETTFAAHPENKCSWKIIEKNKDDAIYEWVLPKQDNDVPPQHEVARIFLTENGVHCIAFNRQYTQMSPEERQKWIVLLKDSIFIVPREEAIKATAALSIADKIKDSLNLGAAFQNWTVMTTFSFDNGFTLVGSIPPSQPETYKDQSYITEALEVVTMPNLNAASIDKLFKLEMKHVQGKSRGRVGFNILKKSPNEIIYSYSIPKDHLKLTAVVRSFISDQGYYSVSYRRGLTEPMKQEDIIRWQEKLEAIRVRHPFDSSASFTNSARN